VDELEQEISETIQWHIDSGFYDYQYVQNMLLHESNGFDENNEARLRAYVRQSFEAKKAKEESWPDITECDRLNTAFDQLRQSRLIAIQNCGLTMTHGGEIIHEILDALDEKKFKGYCFYHNQCLESISINPSGGGLYLCFGAFEDDDSKVKNIGKLICKALTSNGLEYEWDGGANKRIRIMLSSWRRRFKREVDDYGNPLMIYNNFAIAKNFFNKKDYKPVNLFDHPVVQALADIEKSLIDSFGSNAYQYRSQCDDLQQSYKSFLSLIDADALDFLDEHFFDYYTGEHIIYLSEHFAMPEQFNDHLVRAWHWYPKGFDMLRLEEPITLGDLNKQYRKAVIRYEADEKALGELNQAYRIYLMRILDRNSLISSSESASSYLTNVLDKLVDMHTDLWDIKALRGLLKPDSLVGTYPKLILVKKLYLLCEDIRENIEEFLNEAFNKGEDFNRSLIVKELKAAYLNTKKPRVVITHPLQASNAFEAGLIKQSAYKKKIEKFAVNDVNKQIKIEAIENYSNEVGFIDFLPVEKNIYLRYLVHDIEYEPHYCNAFTSKTSYKLVSRCIRTRLQYFVLSIYSEYEDSPIDRISEECTMFLKVFSDGKHNDLFIYNILEELIDYICQFAEKTVENKGKMQEVFSRRYFYSDQWETNEFTLSKRGN